MNGESEVEEQIVTSREEEVARPSSPFEGAGSGGGEGSSPKSETQPKELEQGGGGENVADPPPPTPSPAVSEQHVKEPTDPEEEEE